MDIYNQTNNHQINQVNHEIEQITKLEEFVQTNKQKISQIVHEMDELKQNVNNEINVEHMSNSLHGLKQEINQMKEMLNQLSHQQSSNQSIRVATERLKRIERTLRSKQISIENVSVPVTESKKRNEEKADFDYYLFEEFYRGSREDIKARQKQYMEYFSPGQYVVDLGCGRGEFTELLIENGINATAVDLNDDMILYCQERGFPIVKSDIIAYLHTLENNSLDGIFLGQVIEHIQPDELIELVNLSHEKLKPTGLFIAETPNPQCLSIFAQSFYMDPTHIKPVHAYTAKFILESAGYSDVKINYISPNDESLRLPELWIEGVEHESLDHFNKTVKHWNEVIFGCQDYNIMGRK